MRSGKATVRKPMAEPAGLLGLLWAGDQIGQGGVVDPPPALGGALD